MAANLETHASDLGPRTCDLVPRTSYPVPQLWPPHVPTEANPTAVYRTSFVLPAEWVEEYTNPYMNPPAASGGGEGGGSLRPGSCEVAFLRFEGVDSAFYVWLNGAPPSSTV